ncbi:MAG: MgtC/SapB family protein [Candidatus Sungbacteria bacterium]|nr:MgtC/SapB family protein [Candidatus Sungbacteria bacterium]
MFLPTSDSIQIFYQLLLAVFLGAIIGFEREVRGKPAGLRTYAMVALGACLFTVISIDGFTAFSGNSNFDPARIASNVVVGIGFLGGGLIFLKGDAVRGLTTAAGLWISAAIGVAVGAELYWPAVFATAIALVILIILKWLEFFIHRGRVDEVSL